MSVQLLMRTAQCLPPAGIQLHVARHEHRDSNDDSEQSLVYSRDSVRDMQHTWELGLKAAGYLDINNYTGTIIAKGRRHVTAPVGTA
jgi:hypothetical protein